MRNRRALKTAGRPPIAAVFLVAIGLPWLAGCSPVGLATTAGAHAGIVAMQERSVDDVDNRWGSTGNCIERWDPTGEPDVPFESYVEHVY